MENIFYVNAEKKLSEVFLYFKSQVYFKVFKRKLAHMTSRIRISVCCFAFWLSAGSVVLCQCIVMHLYLASIQRRKINASSGSGVLFSVIPRTNVH